MAREASQPQRIARGCQGPLWEESEKQLETAKLTYLGRKMPVSSSLLFDAI